jgi:hypothetical protein
MQRFSQHKFPEEDGLIFPWSSIEYYPHWFADNLIQEWPDR